MNLEERAKQFEERLDSIGDMLRKNRDPSVIAEQISQHYLATSKECMQGYTPSPGLRDYWFKFYLAYKALSAKCLKIEDSQ